MLFSAESIFSFEKVPEGNLGQVWDEAVRSSLVYFLPSAPTNFSFYLPLIRFFLAPYRSSSVYLAEPAWLWDFPEVRIRKGTESGLVAGKWLFGAGSWLGNCGRPNITTQTYLPYLWQCDILVPYLWHTCDILHLWQAVDWGNCGRVRSRREPLPLAIHSSFLAQAGGCGWIGHQLIWRQLDLYQRTHSIGRLYIVCQIQSTDKAVNLSVLSCPMYQWIYRRAPCCDSHNHQPRMEVIACWEPAVCYYVFVFLLLDLFAFFATYQAKYRYKHII